MAVAYECDRLLFWVQVSLSSCYFGTISFFGCRILVSDIDNEPAGLVAFGEAGPVVQISQQLVPSFVHWNGP